MNILVTGGSGLVGMAIKRMTSLDLIFVSSHDYNLTSENDVSRMFETHKPDIVVHLAAQVGGLYKNMADKVKMFEDNITMNMLMVKYSHKHHVKKFIGCLSTCVFPSSIDHDSKEIDLHNGPPHDSNYTYAYAKRMLDIQCKAYREQYGDNFFCVIPSNIYGPHDNFNLEDAHVIPALIHRCYIAKKEGTPFVIRGSGKALRQFTHADDIASSILNLIHTDHNGGNVIISTPEEVTIEYVAACICECMDYKNCCYDTTYSDGQLRKNVVADGNFTPIKSGLKQTVEWFCGAYPNVRK